VQLHFDRSSTWVASLFDAPEIFPAFARCVTQHKAGHGGPSCANPAKSFPTLEGQDEHPRLASTRPRANVAPAKQVTPARSQRQFYLKRTKDRLQGPRIPSPCRASQNAPSFALEGGVPRSQSRVFPKEIGEPNGFRFNRGTPRRNQRNASPCRRLEVAGAAVEFLPERPAEARRVLETEFLRDGRDRTLVRRIEQQRADAQQSLTLDIASNTARSFEQTIEPGPGQPYPDSNVRFDPLALSWLAFSMSLLAE